MYHRYKLLDLNNNFIHKEQPSGSAESGSGCNVTVHMEGGTPYCGFTRAIASCAHCTVCYYYYYYSIYTTAAETHHAFACTTCFDLLRPSSGIQSPCYISLHWPLFMLSCFRGSLPMTSCLMWLRVRCPHEWLRGKFLPSFCPQCRLPGDHIAYCRCTRGPTFRRNMLRLSSGRKSVW
jgi:hypothetical protein